MTAGDDASFTISNSYLTATISKKTGDLTSLKFHNMEMMGHSSGHPAGYWEQNTGNASQMRMQEPLKASSTMPPSTAMEYSELG